MAKITFNSIEIENFGPFKDGQLFQLSVTDQRPVVLVEALNGSGKTTLLQALQIGLYGYKAINPFRRSDYDKMIAGLIRIDATGDTKIVLDLTVESGDEEYSIILIRSWAGVSAEEKFVAINAGQENTELTENWDEFINGILPVELVQLFLFDGEKIESLANPEKLPQLLKRATEVFLGLGGLDLLNRDLTALERRSAIKRKEALEENKGFEQVEILEQQYRDLENNLTLLAQKQAEARNHLDQANLEFERYTIQARRDGIEEYRKAAELKSRLEIAQRTLQEAKQDLAEGLEDPLLPLIWLGPFWDEYKKLWQLDSDVRRAELIATEFAVRNAKLVKSFSIKVDNDAVQALQAILDSDLAEIKSTLTHTPTLSLEGAPSAVQPLIDTSVMTLKSRLGNYKKALMSLERAEKAVSQIPSEEQVTDVFDELQLKSKVVAEREAILKELNRSIEEAKARAVYIESRLSGARQKIGAELIEKEWQIKSFTAANRAKNALSLYRDKLLASKATWLSGLITQEFKHLLHKKNFISRIVIEPKTYLVSIEDSIGNLLPIERLSAGERQILAIAVLSALISKHKGMFPVVVDTPLARLDSNHREALIKNFFSSISHQVLVLSTDEEIENAAYDALLPFISQEYILTYNDISRSSVLKRRSQVVMEEGAL